MVPPGVIGYLERVYGLASEPQSREIFGWLDGKRTIKEDTSQGKDISLKKTQIRHLISLATDEELSR
jgi:hypothetical protein